MEIKSYLDPQAEVLYANEMFCQWPESKKRQCPLAVLRYLSLGILICLYLPTIVRKQGGRE